MLATTRPLLDITVRRSPAVSRILVTGELDTASAGELVTAAAAAVTVAPGHVEIDLTGVTFADTAGWRAVLVACQQVDDTGRTATVTTGPAVDYLVGRSALARSDAPEQSSAGS
jgi:anti-anti-sigma regulatory factor